MKSLQIQNYTIQVRLPEYAGRRLRIAFFTDLHNCCSDSEKDALFRALESIRPAAVLCGGDSIVARPGADVQPGASFLADVAALYPLWIGTGNHEYRTRLYPESYGNMYAAYRAIVDRTNAVSLENAHADTDLDGIPVTIFGFDMEAKYYGRLRRVHMPEEEVVRALGPVPKNRFTILLAHNPKALDAYFSWGADLTLCGHYHGGIVRFGGNKGLLSPEFRPFPPNAYGHFQKNGKHAIISSGCGEHTLPVRVHNPREVVAVDIELV